MSGWVSLNIPQQIGIVKLVAIEWTKKIVFQVTKNNFEFFLGLFLPFIGGIDCI